MYDLLIVGAGISSATLCAALKHRLRVCVLDVRPHLGGNCYDFESLGTRVHRYGPHVFHSTSPQVVSFLSRFTEWDEYRYWVEAEIEDRGRLFTVPFPYSRLTTAAIGRDLTEAEVLEKFFHGYSRKMWGMEWDELPASVRGRVPKDTGEASRYYPDQFVALPRRGFTRMIENMFDGVELVLGAGPHDWERVPARRVVYCGRPDLIRVPGKSVTFGEAHDLSLGFRGLDITFRLEDWGHDAAVVNFRSGWRPHTRKVGYARMTGGASRAVSYEMPVPSPADDLNPFYPIPLQHNHDRHHRLVALLSRAYPHLSLCGRLATYKYINMFQAVGQALALVKREFPADDAAADLGRTVST